MDRARDLRRFYETYRGSLPADRESVPPEPSPPSSEATKGLVGRVADLLEAMWVPDPDRLPLDLPVAGDGFRTVSVNGRPFSWRQQGRKVARCWFTREEEQWLLAVVGLLPEADHRDRRREQYQGLQDRAVDYLSRCFGYQFGVYAAWCPSTS